MKTGQANDQCPTPKAKSCYTCGQEGHIASACPTGPAAGGAGFGGAAGGGGGGECYRCGKPGHIVSSIDLVLVHELTVRPECAPSLVTDSRVASVEVTEVDSNTVVDSRATSHAT